MDYMIIPNLASSPTRLEHAVARPLVGPIALLVVAVFLSPVFKELTTRRVFSVALVLLGKNVAHLVVEGVFSLTDSYVIISTSLIMISVMMNYKI